MIQLTLTITEEPHGVCVYHQLLNEDGTNPENQKLNIMLAGIREAIEAEARRLEESGCGQTMAGPDALAVLGLKEGKV